MTAHRDEAPAGQAARGFKGQTKNERSNSSSVREQTAAAEINALHTEAITFADRAVDALRPKFAAQAGANHG